MIPMLLISYAKKKLGYQNLTKVNDTSTDDTQ